MQIFARRNGMSLSVENKGLIFGAIGVVAFSLTLPATRYLVTYLDPLFIGLGRSLFASVVAIALLTASRQRLPSRRQLIMLAIVALGVVVGFPVLSAIAMQTLPAAHGGVVLAILPLATAVVGTVVTNERPSTCFWVVCVIGAGLVIGYSVIQSGIEHHSLQLRAADLLLLLAVLSAAIGYAFGAKLANEIGGWQVICWALAVAAPFLLYPTLIVTPVTPDSAMTLWDTGLNAALFSLPGPALISFLYLTLVSQLFGFFFWYRGLALGGVARVSQLQLLQPFITIAASAWLLQEVIDASTAWFSIAVFAVVAVSKRMTISHRTP